MIPIAQLIDEWHRNRKKAKEQYTECKAQSNKKHRIFTKEKRKEAEECLLKKTKGACIFCGEGPSKVRSLYSFLANNGIGKGGGSFPSFQEDGLFVTIVCENCGHTSFFNAEKMGLLNEKEGELNEKNPT